MSNLIINSNDFLNVYKPGNIWQLRVLHAALAQINPTVTLDHNEVFSVSSDQLAAIIGKRPTTNGMKSAARDLFSMVVTIEVPNGASDNAGEREEYIHVVSACRYDPAEDLIALCFSPAIIPLISQLWGQFTRLDARHIMKMRSGFGIRLYELCMRHSGLGDYNLEYDLQKFRLLMCVDKYKYQAFGDLNARVIRPALDDVNKFSDMEISCHTRKDGKKVTGLSFRIAKLEIPERRRANVS